MPSISALTTAVPNLRRVPTMGAGRLFRSAAPSGLDRSGINELTGLGVGTIVDLREAHETQNRPDYIPAGARHRPVPLYRGPLPVATPIGEVYDALLNERGADLTAAVTVIATTLPGGVLVHCAAGKDRTGLVIALILEAAGIQREAILADYELSAAGLPPAYHERTRNELTRTLGAGPALDAALHLHLASPAEALQGALKMLDHRYGGAADYLQAHGLHSAELAVLRAWLTVPGFAKARGSAA